MYPMGNENHCHTDSNFHRIQFIRLETRTTVKPILILTLFNVSDGKRRLLSNRFYSSLCSVYPMENEDHSHINSKSHCIQYIRWETRSTVLLILILTVGNDDNCSTDSDLHCNLCIHGKRRLLSD